MQSFKPPSLHSHFLLKGLENICPQIKTKSNAGEANMAPQNHKRGHQGTGNISFL